MNDFSEYLNYSDEADKAKQLKIMDKNSWQITVTDNSEHYAFLLSDLHTEIEQFAKWDITLNVIETGLE